MSTAPKTSDPIPNEPNKPPASGASNEFESLASEKAPGLLRELFDFIRENKIWWMAPIVIVLLVVGLLIFLSSTAAAPFIYPLF